MMGKNDREKIACFLCVCVCCFFRFRAKTNVDFRLASLGSRSGEVETQSKDKVPPLPRC